MFRFVAIALHYKHFYGKYAPVGTIFEKLKGSFLLANYVTCNSNT